MDDRLKNSLEFANYRLALFNRKEDLKLKVDTMMKHSINGGLFTVTQTLITFVKMLKDENKTSVVLIDNNGNPIMIDDIATFYDDIFNRYFETSNFYYTEYDKIKKSRTVASIYGIKTQ